MLARVRDSFAVGLLGAGIVVCLQVGFLLNQLGTVLNDWNLDVLQVAAEARGTMALLRDVTREQRGYYRDTASHVKALTRAASIDAFLLGRYIQHLDGTTPMVLGRFIGFGEDVSKSATDLMVNLNGETMDITKDLRQSTFLLNNNLQVLRGNLENLEKITGDPSILASQKNIERSTANIDHATKTIDDILNPRKRSFWRRLLELMIPRPVIGVR